MLKDSMFMIKVLIVTSILMFLSLFLAPPKVIGLFLLLWVVNVFWILKLLFSSYGLGLGDFEKDIYAKIDEASTNKKYFQKGLYYITIPMMAIGLIMVALIILAFFTIL